MGQFHEGKIDQESALTRIHPEFVLEETVWIGFWYQEDGSAGDFGPSIIKDAIRVYMIYTHWKGEEWEKRIKAWNKQLKN